MDHSMFDIKVHTIDTRSNYERLAESLVTSMSKGLTLQESVELLVGEGHDDQQVRVAAAIVERSVRQAYAPEPEASPVPSSYDDVRDRVEEMIQDFGPADTVDILAGENHGYELYRTSDKNRMRLEETLRYAMKAEDPRAIEEVHQTLKPHLEHAITASQMLAKQGVESGVFKFAETSEGVYRVKDSGQQYEVKLAELSCTCPRYVLGGFNHVGLVCEHVIAARNLFDPAAANEETGVKRVYSSLDERGRRLAWCDRYEDEIDIDMHCRKASCPFLDADEGECVRCTYG